MLQYINKNGLIKNLTDQQIKNILKVAECQTIDEFLNTEAKYFDGVFVITE